MTYRTRFSPAPTGWLHVGSARTALFDWLAARHHGGEVLLRVEDTNAELYRPEYVEAMLRVLDWLGIGFDGETVFQSKRAERYAEATAALLESGAAYFCDCTADDLKARNGGAQTGYDGHCRDRGLAESPATAVRFRTPDEGETAWDDVIRERVAFPNAALEDFVIRRSNGSATFFLPNAVDDVDMGITHVVRGDDLVNTTPKVLLIRDALGYGRDVTYAHLPMLVDERRKKLSKRRDDASVESFRDQGYLPEAMRNYLAVLGWGPPDGVEIRPIDEIVERFRVEDVVKSPAFFDLKKLDHFNGEYIRRMGADEFAAEAAAHVPAAARELWPRLAPHVQTRLVRFDELAATVGFLAPGEVEPDERAWQKHMTGEVAGAVLDAAVAAYESAEWAAPALHPATAALAEGLGLSLKKAQFPIRVAVTGTDVGPPLFESMEVLGRETTLARLRHARERLAG